MKIFLPVAALLFCFNFALAQNEWYPVSTAIDPIQSVQNVNDTLYGHVVDSVSWQIRKWEDGFWKMMKPIALNNETPIMIERFKGQTYALTTSRLIKCTGTSWVTVLTENFFLMRKYRNRIILHGGFTSFQGSLALGLAYFDGTNAGVLKMPNNQIASLTGGIGQMEVYNDKLYFSGNMSNTQLGPTPCKMVVWNDTNWSNPFLPLPGYPDVYGMIQHNGQIYFQAEPLPGSSKSGIYKIVGQIAEPVDSLQAGTVFYYGGSGLTSLAGANGRIYSLASVGDSVTDSFGYTYFKLRKVLMTYDGVMWKRQSLLVNFDTIYNFNPYKVGYMAYGKQLISVNNAVYGFLVASSDPRAYIHMLDTNFAAANLAIADLRNNPCVLDSAERFIPAMVEVNNGSDYYYTSATGTTKISLPLGQTNTLRVKSASVPYYQAAQCSDSVLTFSSTSKAAIPVYFFQTPTAPMYDVAAHIVGQTGWRARHGFYEDFYLIFKNNGTENINQLTALFNYPQQSTFFSSTLAPLTNVGGACSFLVTNLKPGEQKTIVVKLLNTTALVTGSTINFSLQVGIPHTDANPLNNLFNLPQVVVGAYDPNNKLVNRERVAQWGGELQYQINFQNLGTDTATRVVVVDTLPAEVFPGTFRLLASSDDVEVQLHNRLIHFVFDKINLPDSATAGDKSKGFVQFAITMQDQLNSTDTIKNRAHIFFDFQPAVITNYARTYYHFPFGEEELSLQQFSVYPNPSGGLLTIKSKHGGAFTLHNSLGQVVWQSTLEGDFTPQTINLAHLKSGMYYLSDSEGTVQKLVLMRE
jgi:uncharacterized repeat protein (TIGR01451 family)